MTASPTRPRVPNRVLTTVLTVVVPLLVLGFAISQALSFAPHLPDPVATHWGLDGKPDGFGSVTGTLWLLAAMVVLFSALAWVIGFFLGSAAATRRLAAFFGIWLSVAMSGLLVGSLAMQRGLASATEATNVGTVLGWSFGVALLLGALAAFLMPGDRPNPTSDPVPADAARLPLADSESAAWTQTATMNHLPWIAGGGLALLALLGTLGQLAGVTLGVLIPALGLVLVMGHWAVTVDHTGLTARTILPWPRSTVPLAEVTSAEVINVQPLADFGGWGYRISATGRVGIVVRSGDAILVRRTGGREYVITVDDAHTGAALLNTLADRTRLR